MYIEHYVINILYLLKYGKDEDKLLVLFNDLDTIAELVCRILREPELSEHLSSNASSKVEKFGWSVILLKLELLLREVSRNA